MSQVMGCVLAFVSTMLGAALVYGGGVLGYALALWCAVLAVWFLHLGFIQHPRNMAAGQRKDTSP